MANTVIKLKSSGVTGNVPNNLEPGELAINYVDGKLFYGNTSCNAILFDVNNPAGLEGELQFNNSGEFGSSANLKFDNTTKTLNVKNVFANGNVVTDTLTVIRTTNLGNVSNVTITGGSANQFLITDGLGNLSFGVGTMGAQGAAGAQGAVGAQGAQGAQGSVGAQGAQGIAGAQGVQGATGQAAPWEVFTANTTAVTGQQLIANTYGGTFTITLPATPYIGNVVRITDGYDWSINNLVIARNGSTIEGTTSDVIVDVKGTTVEFVYDNVTWQVVSTIGPMGNTGPQGIQGTIGPQGFQGVAGAQGALGAQGDVGAQGVQGAVGAQGVQGATGAQGAIGAQGVQGATGAQGAQGPQGATPTIAGSNTQIQFNNAGSLGASANLVWDGTGLGIGTSPGSKLDVLRSSTSTAAFDESLIRAINSAAATLNQRVDIGMRFQDGTYNGIGGISMIRESATARSGALSFSSIGSDGNPTSAMRLDSLGNVGIGTTSPVSRLNISDGAAMYAASTGEMIQLRRTPSNGNNTTSFVGISFGNGSNGFRLGYGGSTDRFRFIDGGEVEVLSLVNGGNVGIGTSSPTAKLNVATANGLFGVANGNSAGGMKLQAFNASGNANGYLAFEGYTAEYGRFDANGRFGIGLSNPSYTLDVTGTAHISSSAYLDSLVSGYIPHTGVIGWGATVGGSQTIAKLKWGSYGRIQHTSFGNIPFLSFNAELYESDYAGSGSGQSSRNYFRPDYNLGQYSVLSSGNGGFAFNVGNWSSNNSINLSALGDHASYAGGVLPTGNWEIKNSIGIGTDAPNAKLTIIDEDGGQAMIQMRNYNTTATGAFVGTYATELRSASTGAVVHGARIHLHENNDDRRTLDVSDYNGIFASFVNGKVGIGTTTPSTKLTVAKAIDSAAYGSGTRMIDFKSYYPGYDVETVKASLYAGVDNTGTLNTASGYFAIQTSLADTLYERLRINSLGTVLIGTTTITDANQALLVLQAAYPKTRMEIRNDGETSALYAITFRNGNGLVGSITTSGSATSFNTSSDYRLKRDVQPMTDALAKVIALKPVTYKWKADGSDGQGFIAHELAEVCPDAVTGVKDEVNGDGSIKPQGVDSSFLVATLTSAIQEQQALITQLTARITALEGS